MSRLVAVAVLVGMAVPRAAQAHAFSVAYSDVTVAEDRTAARYRLRINAADLAEPLGLPPDTVATDAQIREGADRLAAYAAKRIELEGDGVVCVPKPEGVSVVKQTERFAQIAWTCGWDRPIGQFAIEYDLFFDLDPDHSGMLKVTHGADQATGVLIADASRFEWDLAEPPPQNLGEFVLSGVDHILYGPDHILFLLGLLLIAAITGLKHTLAIVTSFTVAHSITLIAAALGWFTLPSRLVESLIALSIVWVAAENIWLDNRRWRWLLTFGFGLVHGLGFASMLTPLLPESQVVLPLLAFNVGVELGQLAIVAVAFPVLVVASRRAGLARYRRFVIVPGSVAVGVMGALWFVERWFETAIF